MTKSLIVIGALCLMAVGGCKTTEGQKENYHDEPFKQADRPHTTAFKYIKNFSGQKVAPGQMDEVQTIRYYQGGKRVGLTQFVVSSWFGTVTEDEIKKRLTRLVKRRFPNDDAPSQAISTYRNLEDFGAYTQKSGCVFMSFYKRLKGAGLADNDGGAPDFIGLFTICGGLTVTPEKFIQSIAQADESDSAAFRAATR